MSIRGKAVGSSVIETRGPQTGINKFTTTSADNVTIQVFGTGTVQFQTNTTTRYQGVDSTPNGTHATQLEFDPAGWSDVGATIDATDGEVTRAAVAASVNPSAWRIIISATGTGKVIARGEWY